MWPTKYAVISDLIYVLRSESSIVLFFGNVSIFANVRQWTYQKKIRPDSVELHTILQHSKNKCSPVCLWSRVKIEPKKNLLQANMRLRWKSIAVIFMPLQRAIWMWAINIRVSIEIVMHCTIFTKILFAAVRISSCSKIRFHRIFEMNRIESERESPSTFDTPE